VKNLEIFWRFLLLGLMSFGGPAAHLGYFRILFVTRLQWLDEHTYTRLIALSHFLPGPSSSQVGFAIGLQRAGVVGAFLAFIAFTLPSFVILYLLAIAQVDYQDSKLFQGLISGLKLFAVVVVLDAVASMSKAFIKERLTFIIFLLATSYLIFFSGIVNQIVVLIVATSFGVLFLKADSKDAVPEKSPKLNKVALILFVALLVGLPFLVDFSSTLKLFTSFYQAGSLVFGGGHVVLPLLQESLVASVRKDELLIGYAAAQAVPGPMFTISSYLGATMMTDAPFVGAMIATLAIFLPGFLLILGLHDSWESYAKKPKFVGAIKALNATVVGLLVTVLYDPVITHAISSYWHVILVLLGIYLLRIRKVPIIYLVLLFGGIGMINS